MIEPSDGQAFDETERSNASDIDEAARDNGCVATPVEDACLSSNHQASAQRIGLKRSMALRPCKPWQCITVEGL